MIKKIFIKNYKDVENVDVRNQYGKVAGIFGILSNLTLGVIKLIIGIISNSVSIMADAINNISDMASSALTVIGFKLTNKKPDKKHPYGYARYEYVSGFVIALLMLIMGLIFIKEAVLKIFNPSDIIINKATYIVLTFAIIVKISQMFIYLDFSKAINSSTLKATATDTRNDIISTSAILISMIIMNIFKINIDAYLALIVSSFIVYSSIGMVKEVLEPIIGIPPTTEMVEKVRNKLLSYECVQGIHDLVLHNYGVGNNFITVHVEIDSNMEMIKAHDLIDNIERDFKKDLDIDLTIHMDPVVLNDARIDNLKKEVICTIEKLDKELKIHDFRVVEGETHTNILFDCVVPHDKKYEADDIRKYLSGNIKNENIDYYYVIEIDKPYCEN